MQTDPILVNGDMNLYAYVANDPINFIDPSGLWEYSWSEGTQFYTMYWYGETTETPEGGYTITVTSRHIQCSSRSFGTGGDPWGPDPGGGQIGGDAPGEPREPPERRCPSHGPHNDALMAGVYTGALTITTLEAAHIVPAVLSGARLAVVAASLAGPVGYAILGAGLVVAGGVYLADRYGTPWSQPGTVSRFFYQLTNQCSSG